MRINFSFKRNYKYCKYFLAGSLPLNTVLHHVKHSFKEKNYKKQCLSQLLVLSFKIFNQMAPEGIFLYRNPPDSQLRSRNSVSKLEQPLENKEGNKNVKTCFAQAARKPCQVQSQNHFIQEKEIYERMDSIAGNNNGS